MGKPIDITLNELSTDLAPMRAPLSMLSQADPGVGDENGGGGAGFRGGPFLKHTF